MAPISIHFQLNDQQPTLVDLPEQFSLEDFRETTIHIYGKNISLWYSFICHGQELDLDNEEKFNKYKSLITSGTTIFTVSHMKDCFLPQTPIQCANGSEIPIRDVQKGDILLAFTEFGEITTSTVEHIFIHEVDEYIEVHFGNNRLQVTGEHPFFMGHGIFCSLNKLHVSDCIYSLIDNNLQAVSITNIKTIKAPLTCVYNLRTTQPHTYFANRIAVHNKPGKTFVDLSKDHAPRRIEWSHDAPKWRIARPGICLEGKCSSQSCVAHKQMVIINIGIKTYNVLTESYKMSKCPECCRYVEPITCAFNRCQWRWEGLMQSEPDVEPQKLSGNWKLADDAYHRFDENINGTVRWLELIIEAKSMKTI